ncbi:HAL/PAL/TAL family ammonia-lyase [Lederbergia panacisoli]|uniref:HAL/PAL/TAL family ammonia-lyase n=1 Tax=Lederbergia panacisoli TaxID=1255251 RepID=UPI00214B601D|nr:aromatic amino acid ammonia-lyase [Lederbergia panacisoli]MCR2821694.1 aromatic amino acid ammonia-lyase [Lederbergia panacisoli]
MTCEQKNLILDGYSLTYENIVEFIEHPSVQVTLTEAAKDRVKHYRAAVDQWLIEDKKAIYGVTTGLGKLKDYVVDEHDQNQFQQNILLSHAVGIGPDFPESVVRLAMLIRANVLARGHSGVRVEMIERILLLLNKGVIPSVPQIGSLGVGDLQPMAHIGLCMVGAPEGRATYNGEEGKSPDLLEKANIAPVYFELKAKEALALIDGSTMVLAASLYAYYQAEQLCNIADMAAAMTIEATRGELDALDPRIHSANNLQTEQETAQILRALLTGTEWCTASGRERLGEFSPRVQDAVSIRSTAQVHGAIKDVLLYVKSVFIREMNASKDNPLIFTDGIKFESLSGGNYHGSHLAYALDFMGVVITDLAMISERRSVRLLDPIMSYGLPANLIAVAGLNTGFALVHANATALVSEMRILAAPSSVGSIPSKGNQEDHNSMAMSGVRKLMEIIDRAQQILAIELLLSAQAIDLISENMKGLTMGKGTSILHKWIRRSINPMWEDRYVLSDLQKMIEFVQKGQIREQFSVVTLV